MHMALCYRPSAEFSSCNNIAALKISYAQGREELCMGVLSYELRIKLDAIERENPLIPHGVPAPCSVR
jgi:hypothetical protein